MYEILRDIAYKFTIFSHPALFCAPLRRTTANLEPLAETIVLVLSGGENWMIVGLFLSTLYHNVTDRQTDKQTVGESVKTIAITAIRRADTR